MQWTQVVYGLCDYMHEHQTLSAPEVVVEQWNSATNSMVSEHVLVRENNRFSFFHEGFFDYAFARRFAGSSLSLLDLLLSGEQHLFRRAQLRQILLYLRDTEFDRYSAELEDVLSSPEVRFHIKQVVFALLASLSEPLKREWDVISSFAGRDFNESVPRQAWMTLRRPAWFHLVDSLGLIQEWLDDLDEAFVDQIVSILRVVQRDLSDRVAELVEQYVGKSARWGNRLVHLAEWGDWSHGRRFLHLIIRLIDEGVLDDARGPIAVNSDSWSLLYPLSEKQPTWCCEVVGHYFSRRRELSLSAGQLNPFDFNSGTIASSQSAEGTLAKLATDAPESFVREVLPFMQAVIQDCASQEGSGLLMDSVWSHRIFQNTTGIKAALLEAMVIALSKLAAQRPDTYRSAINPLRNSSLETIQFLLIRSLASNGPLFADDGVDQLCRSPERLRVGYSSDPHWAAKELIESVSPHCSDEKLRELETMLLGYYTEWERSADGIRDYGYAQFTLLSGITASRRSKEVNDRLAELRIKFGRQEPTSPRPMKVQRAQSPIPVDAIGGMSDEEWLCAIQEHDTDKHEVTQEGEFVGGALELSRTLENEVKQNSKRFAELVSAFPDDANPFYFEAILRGIVDSDLDTNTKIGVYLRCHQIEGRPLGRYICDPIAGVGHEEVPTEALDLVVWYATEAPDPDRELWRTPALPGGEPYYGGDIQLHGVNTVRGAAARALARLIESGPERTQYFAAALEKMVHDSSIAVRSCVAQALIPTLRHDGDLAIELFDQLCDTDDALLETHYVERFMYFGVQTHFEELSPVLERMVNSQIPGVTSAGARLACIAALNIEQAAPIADLCLSGSEAQKIGAAQIMAANVKMATCRSYCEDALARLFDDTSGAVRADAARCFLEFEGSQLEGYESLITGFVNSAAFHGNCFSLLVALEQTSAKLPEVTLLACERFTDVAGLAAGDISTREAGDANVVVKLVLRTYQQSSDNVIRGKCLDLIDRLMEQGAHGIDDALREFER